MERHVKRVADSRSRTLAFEFIKVRTRASKVSQDFDRIFGKLSQDRCMWTSFHQQSHPTSERTVLTFGRYLMGKFSVHFKSTGLDCDHWMHNVMYSFWHWFPICILVQISELARDTWRQLTDMRGREGEPWVIQRCIHENLPKDLKWELAQLGHDSRQKSMAFHKSSMICCVFLQGFCSWEMSSTSCEISLLIDDSMDDIPVIWRWNGVCAQQMCVEIEFHCDLVGSSHY